MLCFASPQARKHQDLYIWMAKTPGGPSVKFNVTNVHTMSELKLTGNHLKGSRPVVYFDPAFDGAPHLQARRHRVPAAATAIRGDTRRYAAIRARRCGAMLRGGVGGRRRRR